MHNSNELRHRMAEHLIKTGELLKDDEISFDQVMRLAYLLETDADSLKRLALLAEAERLS